VVLVSQVKEIMGEMPLEVTYPAVVAVLEPQETQET
jgi:hypothetical protein